MKKILQFLLVGAVSAMFTGCATMTRDESEGQIVQFDSKPEFATIFIRDANENQLIYKGQTPVRLDLKTKHKFWRGKTYKVTVSKDGYDDVVFLLKPRASVEYGAGNAALTGLGLFGWLVVDPMSGAMWNLKHNARDPRIRQLSESVLEITLPCKGTTPENLKATSVNRCK